MVSSWSVCVNVCVVQPNKVCVLLLLKGLIGPSGVPGPAGPKGERVSSLHLCVCVGENTIL